VEDFPPAGHRKSLQGPGAEPSVGL